MLVSISQCCIVRVGLNEDFVLLIKAEDLRTRMVMVKTVPMMKAVVCGLLCERVVLRCYVKKKPVTYE